MSRYNQFQTTLPNPWYYWFGILGPFSLKTSSKLGSVCFSPENKPAPSQYVLFVMDRTPSSWINLYPWLPLHHHHHHHFHHPCHHHLQSQTQTTQGQLPLEEWSSAIHQVCPSLPENKNIIAVQNPFDKISVMVSTYKYWAVSDLWHYYNIWITMNAYVNHSGKISLSDSMNEKTK